MFHRRPIAGLAAAVVVVTGGLASVATGASAATVKAHTPKCFGKTATIVVTGNNKTVRAPKGKQHKAGSVIVALGKGDRVYGGDGNDKICVGNAHSVDAGKGDDDVQFTTGFIHGNDGNDLLEQVGKGNAQIFGDAGNDKIKLAKGNSTVYGGDGNDSLSAGTSGNQTFHGQAGSDTFYSGGATALFDGGAAADAYHIASLAAPHTFVVPGIDDTVNGAIVRVDAPTDAPQDTIAYAGQVGTAITQTIDLNSAFAQDIGANLTIGHSIAAPGRTITGWSINYGDGTPVLSGQGTPPASIQHAYVNDGIHVLTVTLIDSAGKIAVRTVAVNSAKAPSVTATATMTGSAVTVTDTAAADPGYAGLASYRLDYGDGSEPVVGAGAPPATFPAHTFASAGTYLPTLTVIDDHGTASVAHTTSVTAPNPTAMPAISLAITRNVPIDSAADSESGSSSADTISVSGSLAQTVEVGEQFEVETQFVNSADDVSTPGYYGDVDFGDGSAHGFGSPYHAYSTPGPKTVTVTYNEVGMNSAGTPISRSVTRTTTITVLPGHVTARISVPQALEGSFLISTTGTSAPASAAIDFYEVNGPDGFQATGIGAPPAALGAIVPAGEGSFSLQVRDTNGNTDSASASGFSLGNHPIVGDDFGLEGFASYYSGGSVLATSGGGYGLATVSTLPGDAYTNRLTGSVAPSFGARITGGTLSYGDGTVVNDPDSIETGSVFPQAAHSYATPGLYAATLSVTDSSKKSASKTVLVDVAGKPSATLTVPGAVAPHGAAATTFALAAVPGARAVTQGWTVDFGDGTPAAGGYGPVPTTVQHAYATAGDYEVSFSILNDHGATATSPFIAVAVS